ncbi:Pre-mRNA-processing protein 40C, partial [Tetrabaena socialis]
MHLEPPDAGLRGHAACRPLHCIRTRYGYHDLYLAPLLDLDDPGARHMTQVLAAWTVHKSDDSSVYYYNTVTEESSWEKPAGFRGEVADVSEAPVPVETKQVGDTEWQEVKCSDGRVYFYHPDSE